MTGYAARSLCSRLYDITYFVSAFNQNKIRLQGDHRISFEVQQANTTTLRALSLRFPAQASCPAKSSDHHWASQLRNSICFIDLKLLRSLTASLPTGPSSSANCTLIFWPRLRGQITSYLSSAPSTALNYWFVKPNEKYGIGFL
ncbi:unnamed protein product [Toxocara canis]|uniref:Uncharacterized protein n=1 Tax=Toxocara canis TaxID=6265 RepID=A0A183UPN7_TOXCA|nr:unnamed protein product [Toxocara canis]